MRIQGCARLALACLCLVSPVLARTPQEGPALAVSEERVEFGAVFRGESVRRSLRLENRGSADLALHRLGANCGCAALRLSTPRRLQVPIDAKNQGAVDLVLGPGDVATLTLTVDTAQLPEGRFEKQVMILSSDPASPHRVPFGVDVKVPSPEAAPAPTGPAPRIEADRYTADLGALLRGEAAAAVFTLRNDGEGDLELQDVRATCQCVASRLWWRDQEFDREEIEARIRQRDLATLAPGEEARLEVELDTASLAVTLQGQVLRKSVRIYSNDPLRNVLLLHVEARVEPAFQVEPEHLRFDPVHKGDAATRTLTIRSEHIDGYRLLGVEVPRPEVLAVEVAEVEGGARPRYEVRVDLLPTAPIGRVSDPLVFRFEHPRVRELVFPVYAEVQSQVVFHGNGPVGTDRINFGVLDGQSDGVVDVRIENLAPAMPYVPETVEISSRHGDVFRWELEEREAGVEYVLRLIASRQIQDRFFSGRVRITSQHPDVPVKLLDFRGWMDRRPAGEGAPGGGEDPDRR